MTIFQARSQQGGARGAFAPPPPTDPKGILVLKVQHFECGRLKDTSKTLTLNSDSYTRQHNRNSISNDYNHCILWELELNQLHLHSCQSLDISTIFLCTLPFLAPPPPPPQKKILATGLYSVHCIQP